ncbi:hypothetical protein TNCV_4175341 [Trichonephila clavipes]|nr:hypothetical protein TNCV_4175341 [Trichonephila clavipes]
MEYLQRLEFFVMSPDLNPIGHVWNVFGCSLQLEVQLRKPLMRSREPRDSKVGTITAEVDKVLVKHFELKLQELCSIRGNHTLLDMFFME